MTRDDIIRMAREVGFQEKISLTQFVRLARFAALVAAHEREACAVHGGAAAMAGLNYMEVADAIRGKVLMEDWGADPFSATRRAIVRARQRSGGP